MIKESDSFCIKRVIGLLNSYEFFGFPVSYISLGGGVYESFGNVSIYYHRGLEVYVVIYEILVDGEERINYQLFPLFKKAEIFFEAHLKKII